MSDRLAELLHETMCGHHAIHEEAAWALAASHLAAAGVTVAPDPQGTAKEPQSLASPRPGIDRLACPGCGTTWENCRSRSSHQPRPCCARCRHDVRVDDPGKFPTQGHWRMGR